jgi:iron complex transport system substrate-binding protein
MNRKSLSTIGRFVALAVLSCASLAAQAPKTPQRVVLGGRAIVMVADLVYAFPAIRPAITAIAGTDQGMGEFLVNLDPAFRQKTPLDRQAGAESYAALKPDLVIMKSAMKKSLGAQLEALGISQLYLNLETPDDYYWDIAELGIAIDQTKRAADLINWYRSKVEGIAQKLSSDKSAPPRVLVVQASRTAGGSFEVPPREWMQTVLVGLAGGQPLWLDANPGSGWGKIGFEQIAAWNPDVLLVISYTEDVDGLVAQLRADPRFASLACARTGRIFGFPQDFYSWDQPDTRWILGLQWMARALHPAAFAEGSTLADAREFFRFLYGFDDASFDRVILPRLKGDHALP